MGPPPPLGVAEVHVVPASFQGMDVRVRAPRESDIDAVYRIHADPRTNTHWPERAIGTVEQAHGLLALMLEDWQQHGIGYWAVTTEEDEVIGFSGLRVKPAGDSDYLNLYYRYAPEVWGQGIARHVAGQAVALAHEQWPDRPVIARMRGTNLPSQRVALAVGLSRAGNDSQGRVIFADRRLYPSFLELLQ